MSNQFVAEIRLVPYDFAPAGWAFCQGQLLPISQNTALFSLLGTTYGGDGKSTFALPDLQGQVPVGWAGSGQGGLSQYYPGQTGGSPTVTLLPTELPAHTHNVLAVDAPGTTGVPANASLAIPHVGRLTESMYTTAAGTTALAPTAFGVAGGSMPHNNMQPYLTLNYIIAMQGVFPPRP